MRRAGEAGLVVGLFAASLLAAGSGPAAADAGPGGSDASASPSASPSSSAKISVTAEAGAEADSNVQRLETGPEAAMQPTAAPVARLGARLTRVDRALGGAYALGIGALSRTVLSGDDDLAPENVVLLSGDLRWMRPIGDRGVSVGRRPPRHRRPGPRQRRRLAHVPHARRRGPARAPRRRAARDHHRRRRPRLRLQARPTTTTGAGRPASVQLDLTLWERDQGARSVELAVQLGFEARAYGSAANASACAEGALPDKVCYAGTSLRRSDRFQRGGLELTWTGGFVAAASYQVSVTDSNSYGQSIVRHRASRRPRRRTCRGGSTAPRSRRSSSTTTPTASSSATSPPRRSRRSTTRTAARSRCGSRATSASGGRSRAAPRSGATSAATSTPSSAAPCSPLAPCTAAEEVSKPRDRRARRYLLAPLLRDALDRGALVAQVA